MLRLPSTNFKSQATAQHDEFEIMKHLKPMELKDASMYGIGIGHSTPSNNTNNHNLKMKVDIQYTGNLKQTLIC